MESKYDVFIAYNLNAYANSSEALRQSNYLKALEINNYLSNLGYSAFLLQPDDPNADYTKTPQIASKCKLFLFVTDKNISQKCNDGVLRNNLWIFNELNGFMSQDSISNKHELAKPFVQVYTEDYTLSDSEVNKLHLVLRGINPIRNKDNLKNWLITNLPTTPPNKQKQTGWDADVAAFWENIYVPARPSTSEIEFYRKYFKYKKKFISIKPKVLILGSTEALIKLAIDEHFDIYIVDNSKSYCDTVLKKFEECNTKITPIYCSWEDMEENNEIKNIKFDIIIGDMSIGNISHNNIEKTIATISSLLKTNGLWLGKSIYKFSKKSNRDEIKSNIKMLLTNRKLAAEHIFSSTVYDIAMLSCKKESHINSIKCYEMSFEQLAITSQELCDDISKKDDIDFSSLTNIYKRFNLLGKKKIPFYIYHIKHIASLSNHYHLLIKDVGFSNDTYSSKFPLIVFEKGNPNISNTIDKSQIENYLEKINTFFPRNQSKEFAIEWAKHLPSQYYLVKLSKLVNMETSDQWANTCNCIKTDIIDSVNLGINTNLFCIIKELNDTKIDDELGYIKNSDLLSDDEKQKLKESYKLAVLLYLSTNLTEKNDSKTSALYNLVINKLFESHLYDNICNYWFPEGATWLTAKVCNAAYGTSYSNKNNKRLKSTIIKLITNYDFSTHNWTCTVGSHMDTCALCVEAILNYYSDLQQNHKDKASKVLKDILTTYALNHNIYETIILHPLGQYVIEQLQTQNTSESIIFQKKVLGNVAFFSSLLRIINFFKTNEPELLKNSKCEQLVLKHLMNFWEYFSTLDESTFKRINSIDICTVPQILYSLSQALASEIK